MKFSLIIFFFSLLFSCTFHKLKNDIPVAKVFDSELRYSEVAAFIPSGTSPEDSILMSQNYIRNWITKKLLLHKAIENLSEQEKNIHKQVEDYRTSLLIHKYKQKLIAQKLQAEIREQDIENYYETNKQNFILTTPVVKAVFFIIPKSASNIKEVKKWYKSEDAKDLEKLEEYCITNAKKYDDFGQKWIESKYLTNLFPPDSGELEKEILYSKYIEKEDDENFYFLKIQEICKEQEFAPLGYVRDEIILILKNKKKLEFENELDKQINEEALRKNYVKIY
ncbi:peptidyl-prolyl cis-trans isomerase [uncultured Odoribacter sp.]|uniref:peptidyl-prolyl cis-trans isomerase n=1 Tax=uncultured Odoribacter sp. TaxID=876416 RepID=UPI002625D4A2|nr:peptidyl-prolyl cis-trans isomerase [uncultured Odoribacter sp.]